MEDEEDWTHVCVFLLARLDRVPGAERRLDSFACYHVPLSFRELENEADLSAMLALTNEKRNPFKEIDNAVRGMSMRTRFQPNLSGPYILKAPTNIERDTMQFFIDHKNKTGTINELLGRARLGPVRTPKL